ncbi:uncharacterized protein LOC126034262 [Accipiter gentilis]|uniref:uncharacterized protein LOC126034262 n=1 Tax=Astur gentilis TaxID=8957 RepID=UPI00210F28CD|nr:uncharacterized protein LOC126034262 [Accipiter gentilis]
MIASLHPAVSLPVPTVCTSPIQGTSSFDETITEPALRLPTGSRKVLFITGCWKGHGVLLPLLFLAHALSPSERGSAPVRWTPDKPSRCGRSPDASTLEAGPAQGSTGLPNHSGLRSPRTQLCMHRSTCNCMRSPGDPLHPGEAAADPHRYPLHPGTSWEGCEPKKSCRGAQLPFPASPACPDGVVSLDLASLYRAQPFPALGQPEEA